MKRQKLIEKIITLRKKIRKDTSAPQKSLYCKHFKRSYKLGDYSTILFNYKRYLKSIS